MSGMIKTMKSQELIPYVIAVFHHKGGVGKTTAAINLGACFAELQQETLIIDLDPSANLTSGVGIRPANVRHSIADVLLGNETLVNVSQPTEIPRLDIIPTNNDMQTVAKFFTLRSRYEHLLRKNIAALISTPKEPDQPSKAYKWVIMDCPPSVGPLVITAIIAANLLIIPIKCEYYSLQNLKIMFEIINTVRHKYNPNLSFRLLISLSDQRDNMQTRIMDEVRKFYGPAMFDTVISYDNKLGYSQIYGKSIIEYAPKSLATEQFRALAQEIINYNQR